MAGKLIENFLRFIGMDDGADEAPRDPRDQRGPVDEPKFSTNRYPEERSANQPVSRRNNITPASLGSHRNSEQYNNNGTNYSTGQANNRVSSMSNSGPAAPGIKMVVFQPQTYEDSQTIIDNLKAKKPIIVNLENLNIDVAQRVLDFISGAIYALDGSVRKVSKGIFLLAPKGIDIAGNFASGLPGSVSGKSYFNKPNK